MSNGHIGNRGRETVEFVGVTWSECHLGGRRRWFTCAGCRKRLGKLYHLKDHGFRCRQCGGFVYASQRELRKRRGWQMSRKIRMKLNGDPDLSKLLAPKPGDAAGAISEAG
jgi:hypothetical protein